MIVPCAGQCGRRVVALDSKRIYLCRKCWTTLINVVFDLIRRGTEVFTVIQPTNELLN